MDKDSQAAHWPDAGYARTGCAYTAGRIGELSTESVARLLFWQAPGGCRQGWEQQAS